jgi:hypothetical protein
MEHMVDDVSVPAEAEGRRLLLAAFDAAGDEADGLAGAELLRAVRRRTSRRRRTMRALVPAGAVTALAGAVAAALALTVTTSVATAPSAFAAVTAAAARMSDQSFQVSMNIATNPPPTPGSGRVQAARVVGEFDESRGVGQETVSGPWRFLVRYVGQNTYLDTLPGSKQVIFTNQGASKPWAQFPPEQALAGNALADTGNAPGATPVSPLTLLRQLKSAGTVTDEGAASGPGWTGTKYGFTITVFSTKVTTMATVGYLDVDGQGRVRRLVAELTVGPAKKKWVMASEDVTFSDFGLPVSVSAPPADQIYQLKAPVAMISLGW